MLEFTHDIIEAWIQKSASRRLGGLKRALVQAHLKRCARCRSVALDLIEFENFEEAGGDLQKLSAAESGDIHARVMAAFHRERQGEQRRRPFQRATGPAIRPSFVKALAMVALIVTGVAALSYPFRRGHAPDAASEGLSLSHPPLPTPEPNPTAAPTATSTPAPASSPTPVLKTENK